MLKPGGEWHIESGSLYRYPPGRSVLSKPLTIKNLNIITSPGHDYVLR